MMHEDKQHIDVQTFFIGVQKQIHTPYQYYKII